MIIKRIFEVNRECDGFRLDRYLKERMPRLSRNRIQQIIPTAVDILGKPTTKCKSRVRFGDRVMVRKTARQEPLCPRTFTIIHKDEDLLVVNKPPGLPVHASAKYYFNTLTMVMRERLGDDHGYHMCHRIDKETSGLIVFAKTTGSEAFVKKQFAKKEVRKEYLAIVCGSPPAESFVVNKPLKITTDPDAIIDIRMMVDSEGLPSKTEFSVLKTLAPNYALVLCRPKTGRMHQIRVHLASEGVPILGDKLYRHGDEFFRDCCDGLITEEMKRAMVMPRQALHAASIEFTHPKGGRVRYYAPLPVDMQEVLK